MNKFIKIISAPIYWLDRELAERFEVDFVLEEADFWGAAFLVITIGGLILMRVAYSLVTGA